MVVVVAGEKVTVLRKRAGGGEVIVSSGVAGEKVKAAPRSVVDGNVDADGMIMAQTSGRAICA